jgi:putative thiamine transport system ATP-binding protein
MKEQGGKPLIDDPTVTHHEANLNPNPKSTALVDVLRLQHVSITVAGRTLLADWSVEVRPGEVLTVMGPSGAGKSSLLAWVGGFLRPPFDAHGALSIGTDRFDTWPAHQRRAGILFQDDLLFPHLSVAGNLLFGVPADVRGRAVRRALVESALADADLEGFGNRDPATLSGGQRARVALLRTLLARPRMLLLDEPFGKLDARLRHDFRVLVFERARQLGLPTLLVTHDEGDAEAAGGPVKVLE